MPTFCRHNRFAENCPICSKVPRAAPAASPGGGSGASISRRPSTPSAARRRPPRGGDLVVRRVVRSVEDGYEHDLVPGLRATEDAVRLAAELAWAAARLDELSGDPPGLYGEAAALGAAGDIEEALWLTAQIAVLSPLEGVEDPWAAISAARTTWSSGSAADPAASAAAPDLASAASGAAPVVPSDPGTPVAIARGPRAATGTGTLAAYRARAERAGSQVALLSGEASLTPQRRFDRGFDRLAVPGMARAPRYELLVLCGRLGLLDVEPWSAALGEAGDAATLAAKRVFGIGDTITLHRRASELMTAVALPPAALDLALVNWTLGSGDRITAGSRALAAPEVEARAASLLAVSPN